MGVVSDYLLCSNRTIVGLKHELLSLLSEVLKLQQSHHCGIETDTQVLDEASTQQRSNRTIVGLKLQIDKSVRLRKSSSNRTIVGLKLSASRFNSSSVINCSNRTIVGLKPHN